MWVVINIVFKLASEDLEFQAFALVRQALVITKNQLQCLRGYIHYLEYTANIAKVPFAQYYTGE